MVVQEIQPTDLIRYGFIPEFIGRLPVVGVLNDLDKETLVQILSKGKECRLLQGTAPPGYFEQALQKFLDAKK